MFTPESSTFVIKPLDKHHDRVNFSCGNEDLDRYLQRQASQDQRRNIAIPYIAWDQEHLKIIGFYTLSSLRIDVGELPETIAKKLPKYRAIGATLIGRLAVDQNYRGRGWGKLLLMDAIYKSLKASQQVASFAVIVEAKDEQAVSFYQRFDFKTFPSQPDKLFRTMAEIAKAFD